MALANPDAVVLKLMTMNLQWAAHLEDMLRASPHQDLAAEILRCCGRVIAAITANNKRPRAPVEHEAAAAAAGCSPPPAMPPRKRSRGAEASRVVTGATATGDSFIWRKYGQKEINGRKHPRLYQRCAYRHQGCAATRRVQRTQDEPAAYEIAYYGEHTCRGAAPSCQLGRAAPPAVVDFGSHASGGVWTTAPAAAAASEHQQPWSCWDGDVSSQGGWSSPSTSSEAGFEAHTTHDTARCVEQPCGAPPDPVTEFLDGRFDWASVVNDPFDFFGALLQ